MFEILSKSSVSFSLVLISIFLTVITDDCRIEVAVQSSGQDRRRKIVSGASGRLQSDQPSDRHCVYVLALFVKCMLMY